MTFYILPINRDVSLMFKLFLPLAVLLTVGGCLTPKQMDDNVLKKKDMSCSEVNEKTAYLIKKITRNGASLFAFDGKQQFFPSHKIIKAETKGLPYESQVRLLELRLPLQKQCENNPSQSVQVALNSLLKKNGLDKSKVNWGLDKLTDFDVHSETCDQLDRKDKDYEKAKGNRDIGGLRATVISSYVNAKGYYADDLSVKFIGHYMLACTKNKNEAVANILDSVIAGLKSELRRN